jgi:hypothetical protein
MTCQVIGDSLAVGVAAAAITCGSDATVGISTRSFARYRIHPISADTVVISLGANDSQPDYASLVQVRKSVTARRVIWLLPSIPNEFIRATIRELAFEYGDGFVDFVPLTGGHLHATAVGYATMAHIIGLN